MQKLIHNLATFWHRKVHPKISTLIATIGTVGLLSCLVTLYVIAQISEDVFEKEAFAFDKTVLLWIHQFATPSRDRLMVFVTSLGNPNTVVVIVTITLALLLWRRYYQEAKFFFIDCLGGVVLSYGLKLFFCKTRPNLWQSPIKETSYSYPSGHSVGSMVLYGFLAYLLATRYPRFSWLIYTMAGIIIAAICLSRLYLGVHWATDVIGGFGIGFLWVMLCITMLRLQKMNQLSR